MTAVAKLREGELARLALDQAEVLCERCAGDLGGGCVSSLCLAVEGLREIIGQGYGGALHTCIAAYMQARRAKQVRLFVCRGFVCVVGEWGAMESSQRMREQFAENLRCHRERTGLSQEALSEVCGLHRTEISLLERSQRSPRLETIVVLARGLKLDSAGELLDGMA